MAHGFLLAGFAGQFVAISRYVYNMYSRVICIDLFEILLKQCLFTSQSCFNNDYFLLIGLLHLQYLSQRTDPRDRHFCVVPASWCKRCKRFCDLFEHPKVPKSQESLPATTHTRQTNTRTQMINIDIPWISMILRTSHKSSCYFDLLCMFQLYPLAILKSWCKNREHAMYILCIS